MKIVGLQAVAYSKNGKEYCGTRVYYEDDSSKEGLTGIRCDQVYLPNRGVKDFKLGPFRCFASEPTPYGVRITDIIY